MYGALLIIGITVLSAFIASIAQYIFKKNLPRFKANIRELISVFKNKWILFGIFMYFIALPIYLFALDNGALSFVYPTFASSFIFVLLFSKFGLGEKIGPARIIGVLLVVLGIAIVAMTF
jgi:drug/metabolite transporter (DMT)-like permease